MAITDQAEQEKMKLKLLNLASAPLTTFFVISVSVPSFECPSEFLFRTSLLRDIIIRLENYLTYLT